MPYVNKHPHASLSTLGTPRSTRPVPYVNKHPHPAPAPELLDAEHH